VGKAKDKILKQSQQPGMSFELTDPEFRYIRDLHAGLQMHVLRRQYISGLLTLLVRHRQPDYVVPAGKALEYELDMSDESSRHLNVHEVPVAED